MLVQEITNFLCFKVYYDRPVYLPPFLKMFSKILGFEASALRCGGK
jgi:hypothetical protein